MLDVTISIPNGVVPVLQAALDHYNQVEGASLTPRQAVVLAIMEWALPHAMAAKTEQITTQTTADLATEQQRVRGALEQIT